MLYPFVRAVAESLLKLAFTKGDIPVILSPAFDSTAFSVEYQVYAKYIKWGRYKSSYVTYRKPSWLATTSGPVRLQDNLLIHNSLGHSPGFTAKYLALIGILLRADA